MNLAALFPTSRPKVLVSFSVLKEVRAYIESRWGSRKASSHSTGLSSVRTEHTSMENDLTSMAVDANLPWKKLGGSLAACNGTGAQSC
jgi:hypothetical protein